MFVWFCIGWKGGRRSNQRPGGSSSGGLFLYASMLNQRSRAILIPPARMAQVGAKFDQIGPSALAALAERAETKFEAKCGQYRPHWTRFLSMPGPSR